MLMNIAIGTGVHIPLQLLHKVWRHGHGLHHQKINACPHHTSIGRSLTAKAAQAPLVGLLSIGWLWCRENESISQISKHPPVTIWSQEGPHSTNGIYATRYGSWRRTTISNRGDLLLPQTFSSIFKQDSANQHGSEQWLMSPIANKPNDSTPVHRTSFNPHHAIPMRFTKLFGIIPRFGHLKT